MLEAAARASRALGAGIPVLFIRVAFRHGYPEVSRRAPRSRRRAASLRRPDTQQRATRIHSRPRPRDDEPIVTKRRVSAFTGSDLDVLLRARADTLVLAGITTSGVVLSTLRQAADLDFRLIVLADACAMPIPRSTAC